MVETEFLRVIATVHQTTDQIVGHRPGLGLRDLDSRSGEAKTAEHASIVAARRNDEDSKL
jgi:hypothetical protein